MTCCTYIGLGLLEKQALIGVSGSGSFRKLKNDSVSKLHDLKFEVFAAANVCCWLGTSLSSVHSFLLIVQGKKYPEPKLLLVSLKIKFKYFLEQRVLEEGQRNHLSQVEPLVTRSSTFKFKKKTKPDFLVPKTAILVKNLVNKNEWGLGKQNLLINTFCISSGNELSDSDSDTSLKNLVAGSVLNAPVKS